jgi:hypothetical protein
MQVKCPVSAHYAHSTQPAEQRLPFDILRIPAQLVPVFVCAGEYFPRADFLLP